MFRRREENDLLSSTETTENSSTNAAYAPSNTAASAPRPASTGVSEASKAPAAPAAAASYRPTSAPIATPTAPSASLGRFQEPAGRNAPAQNSTSNNASANKQSGSKRVLTVGNDILLKGEIATCDRLVIEGSVDATLKDVHTLELAETGSFKGTAEVEDAEISGLFEGDLIIRNRLVIYSTGQVRGNVTYGEIEIERGGELTGTIKTMNSASTDKAGKKAA